MPSKEEIEAIGRIKNNDIAKPLYCGDLTICNIEDLQIVINLVERQQKELEQLEAERTEVISYMQRMIVMTKEAIKNLADTKYYYERQEMKTKLEVYEEILKLMKGE